MASFRYRAQIPAKELGWGVNDLTADTLILSKPQPQEMALLEHHRVVADFCDDHFDRLPHYREVLRRADAVTCPTKVMRARIRSLGRDAHIVPDPYEYDELAPHCSGNRVLWFGHPTNLPSARRVFARIADTPLRVVSSAPDCIPWSLTGMLEEFALADIVILPATAAYKSPNRAVEAIRQGCFVVAEPHPALDEFPIWKGDIKEGVQWAAANPSVANEMTLQAQGFVSRRFSPKTQAAAWRTVLESVSTSARGASSGPAGSQLATAAR